MRIQKFEGNQLSENQRRFIWNVALEMVLHEPLLAENFEKL